MAGPRDLLVRVSAISVNPVDTKVRRNAAPDAGQAKVLGWDAVGTVEAVGAQVEGFAVGDRVYYAGSITRPGANAELHVVDERIVARAPTSLDDAQAAALPLTTITAWELLFDRLGVPQGGGGRPDAADHRRRGRRGLDPDPARAPADATARGGHGLARRDAAVVPGPRGARRDRPFEAAALPSCKAAGIGEVDLVASLTQTPAALRADHREPRSRRGRSA